MAPLRLIATAAWAAWVAAGAAAAPADDDGPCGDDHPAGAGDATAISLLFAPPPLEGTLSMGVYAADGRLVRVLHREADVEDTAFRRAADGLVTTWDGKDEHGATMPAGEYRVRGFGVGDLGIDGVACHGNDWVADADAPQVARLTGLAYQPDGTPVAAWRDTAGNAGFTPLGAPAAAPPAPLGVTAAAEAGTLAIRDPQHSEPLRPLLPEEGVALQVAVGFGPTVWAVVKTGPATEIRAYSAGGEFLRRLAVAPGDPAPVEVLAAPDRPEIFLREENAARQRVRGLRPTAASGEPGTSTWEVFLARSLVASDSFAAARDLLAMPGGGPVDPVASARVNLIPNPMENDRPGTAEVMVATAAEGSYLALADGLPLRAISDTKGLKWAVMAREPGRKQLVVFQSDGCVVEEFHLRYPANMMAFDLGAVAWRPAPPSPPATPPPAPSSVPAPPPGPDAPVPVPPM